MSPEVIRRAESMLLFVRDGMVDFGAWRRWWNEMDPIKAAEMLAEWEKVSRLAGSAQTKVGNR